jgi:hypothetical protein
VSQNGVTEEEHTAVLVIRAWLGENRSQVRARIIGTQSPDRNVSETVVVGDDEVLATVAQWLRKLAAEL